MATNIFTNITARGTKAQFQNALDTTPQVWQNHVQTIPSDAPDENHVWMGQVPSPRQFVSGRSFVGLRDFTYTVANREYELSFIIDQNSVEDDRHSLVQQRIADAAQVWATYKDSLFATLIEAGDSDNAFDATSFFSDSRTIGDSGTIDNSLTENISSTTAPTLAEAKLTLTVARVAFWGFKDDTGRAGYATTAMQQMRLICDPQYERIFTELNNATLTGGGDSNPFFGGLLASIDVLPYLTNTDVTIYFTATGSPTRQPFIYQERTPLQISIFNSDNEVADNHGLKVLARQRFRMAYGEPRYCVEDVYT